MSKVIVTFRDVEDGMEGSRVCAGRFRVMEREKSLFSAGRNTLKLVK